MAHTVFICHSSKDKTVADAACAALEAHRIPCWIAPRDILAGEEYGASIIEALDDCQVVLLIFSVDANNSPQVHREIERAVSKEKILVPFRIQDVLPSRSMEYALMNTHWLDAISPPLEQRLIDLCNTITRLLARRSQTEPLWQPQQPSTAAPAQSDAVVPTPSSPAPPRQKSLWNTWTIAVLAIALFAAIGAFIAMRIRLAPAAPVVSSPPPTVPAAASAPASAPPAQIPLASSSGPASVPPAQAITPHVSKGGGGRPMEASNYVQLSNLDIVTLQKQADAGVPAAMAELGYRYQCGCQGIAAQNIPRAIALYQLASAKNDPMALNDLSYAYMIGNGVTKDYAQSLVYAKRSADLGFAPGQNLVGLIYLNGWSVTQDYAMAAKYFQLSAAQGYANGEQDLGYLYMNGIGVPKDTQRGLALLQAAAKQGDSDAKDMIAKYNQSQSN